MEVSRANRVSLLALCTGLAACGAGDRSSPLAPSAARVSSRPTATSAIVAPITSMPATSLGEPPDGFRAFFLADPGPDAEGVIRGSSPLTVRFDLCRSRTAPDRQLSFRFDWDMNHVADVVGTGEACLQEHTYDARRVPDARGHVVLQSNVCVVSGDPRTPHDPGTYYSCRAFTLRLTVEKERGVSGFPHHTGYGQTWRDNVPTGTYNLVQALRACQEYVADVGSGVDTCNTTGCGCSAVDECTYNTAGGGLIRRVWFYAGTYIGNTTNNACSTGLTWD